MRLASYNIQYGTGLDGRYDIERSMANVANADILALQEVTRGIPLNGNIDMVAAIQALMPDHTCIYSPALDIYADTVIEDGRRKTRRHQFGNMVLSRWPILAIRMLLLPRSAPFSRLNLQRALTETVIATPAGALRVYCTHLDHVSPDERLCQIEYIRSRIHGFASEGGAITGGIEFGIADPPVPENYILMGDFNMEPGSLEYCALGAHRPGEADSDMPIDALDVMGQHGPGLYSWIDVKDHTKRLHLDYCYINAGLAGRLTSAHVDMTAEGSDHFPVWIEIEG